MSPTQSPSFTVSPTPGPTSSLSYNVQIFIYDSAGALVKSFSAGSSPAAISSPSVSEASWDPTAGPLVMSSQGWSASYDGRSQSGDALPNGSYMAVIRSENGGTIQNAQVTFSIFRSNPPGLSVLIAAPNPAGKGASRIQIAWQPAREVEIQAYNLAGEMVQDLGRHAASPIQWELGGASGQPLAGGIYVIRARIPGEKRGVTAKWVLLR